MGTQFTVWMSMEEWEKLKVLQEKWDLKSINATIRKCINYAFEKEAGIKLRK